MLTKKSTHVELQSPLHSYPFFMIVKMGIEVLIVLTPFYMQCDYVGFFSTLKEKESREKKPQVKGNIVSLPRVHSQALHGACSQTSHERSKDYVSFYKLG